MNISLLCSCTFLYLSLTSSSSIYHLLWHRGLGSRHQIETKNLKNMTNMQPMTFLISRNLGEYYQYQNQRNKEKDWWSPPPNKHPIRFKRSIRSKMGLERNCWLRLQFDPCALTDKDWGGGGRQGRFVLESLLSVTDTSLIRIGLNTQITLAINHAEDFTWITAPVNTTKIIWISYPVGLSSFYFTSVISQPGAIGLSLCWLVWGAGRSRKTRIILSYVTAGTLRRDWGLDLKMI